MEPRADLQRIAEGSEAEIFAWEDGTVLRLLHNPNAQQKVEWEAHAMRAALAAGVRVPAVHGTTTVYGRPGLIMERIDGPDLLTLLGRRPWTVFSVAKTSGQVQARLHGVSAPDSLPALGDRLCHGDFHPGNIMMSDGEAVLIDWTDATRGDPNADFARSSLLLRLGDTPPGVTLLLRALAFVGRSILISSYERAYRRARPPDAKLVTQWEVPVAANRLAADIASERPKLLRFLEERLAANG